MKRLFTFVCFFLFQLKNLASSLPDSQVTTLTSLLSLLKECKGALNCFVLQGSNSTVSAVRWWYECYIGSAWWYEWYIGNALVFVLACVCVFTCVWVHVYLCSSPAPSPTTQVYLVNVSLHGIIIVGWNLLFQDAVRRFTRSGHKKFLPETVTSGWVPDICKYLFFVEILNFCFVVKFNMGFCSLGMR